MTTRITHPTPITRSALTRRSFLLGSLLLTGGALAACGSTGSGADTSPGSGTLRYGAVAAAGTGATDPHGSLFNESDWVTMAAVFDVLTVQDAAGRVQPRLATGWESTDGGATWTITLRDDAVFTDGRPVTARDALYSLTRMHDAAAANGMRLGAIDVAASKVIDDHTLLLGTSTPDAEVPRTLAEGTFVVPDGTTDFTMLVGSGPYRLTARGDMAVTFEANPSWWGPTAASSTVEVRGFSDPTAMLAAVTGGELDVAAGVQPAAARTAERSGRASVTTVPAAHYLPLLLRTDVAPFDSADLRRAVKLGVDRQRLVDLVYLGYGTPVADTPRIQQGSTPTRRVPARDVDGARALVAAAGYPDGIDVVLHTSTAYPGMESLATAVAEQLGEIGIRVRVRVEPVETYWTSVYTVEPFVVGYWADTAFPTWVRQTALSTSAFSETGWNDAGFDDAFASAMATVDETERNAALARLQERMADEGGWVVWGAGDALVVTAQGASGIPIGPAVSRAQIASVTA